MKKEFPMFTPARSAALVSALAIATAAFTIPADAQSKRNPDQQLSNEECVGNQNCEPGDNRREMRRRDRGDDDRVGDSNRRNRDQRTARNWRYDPDRHHRRSHRDSRFRFEFGGYWYDQPYWDRPTISLSIGRIGCGEGRDIVDDSGFNRVRVVECSGRNYTYLGRRAGDTYRVVLNSRSGRIVSVRPI
jgi:hypothetical protein